MKIPPELAHYDPFDKNDCNKILEHFNVRVDVQEERNGTKSWGYTWKYGASTLAPDFWLTEDQARAVAGLGVYLYACGVHPGLNDRLAKVFIDGNRPRIT